jgi:hypothetical protein
LNNLASIRTLRNYVGNIRELDILFIQEHRLQNQAARDLGPKLWPSSTSWCLEASPGYNNDPTVVGAGCGGIITLLHPKWSKKVVTTGAVMTNRAQWIMLSGLLGGDLGFVNIYAYNDTPGQAQLWTDLAIALPANCKWIVAGDFNFVEARNDKTNSCSRMVPLAERMVFNDLKTRLQIEEPPRSLECLQYSWDNLRQDGRQILARLDRCYVFLSTGGASQQIIAYKIKGDTG